MRKTKKKKTIFSLLNSIFNNIKNKKPLFLGLVIFLFFVFGIGYFLVRGAETLFVRPGYTQVNPQLAYARIEPSNIEVDIYKNQDDRWIVSDPDFTISFDGVEYGGIHDLPNQDGLTPTNAIVSATRKDNGGGNYVFMMGSDLVRGVDYGSNPSNGEWSGQYPLYAVLATADIDATGAELGVVTGVEGIFILEGWDENEMGHDDGQDIISIKNLIDNGVVTGAPGGVVTAKITDVRAIFRMFDQVDGNQEEKSSVDIIYEHNWTEEPSDDWTNNFTGIGFGVDVDPSGMKKVHADAGSYTLDGGQVQAGAITYKTIEGSGGDSFIENSWAAEWDYDIFNSTNTLNPGIGEPPGSPLGFYFPVILDGMSGGGPTGKGVGMAVSKGNDDTYVVGFDYCGVSGNAGRPVTPWTSVEDIGRLKVTHDGLGNYSYNVSYDDGGSWSSIGNSSCSLPGGWESYPRVAKFGGMVVGSTTQDIDVRWNDLQIYAGGGTYMADAYRSFQQDDGWGYLIDRLGIIRDGTLYSLVWGNQSGISVFDGSIAVSMRGENDNRSFIQKTSSASEAYYIDNGTHTIETNMATGEYDVYALLFDFVREDVTYHMCALVDENSKEGVIQTFQKPEFGGGVFVDEIRVWQNNGAGNDYTYIGPGYAPRPPSPTYSPRPGSTVAPEDIEEEVNPEEGLSPEGQSMLETILKKVEELEKQVAEIKLLLTNRDQNTNPTTPISEPVPAPTPTTPIVGYYTVQRGDTLRSIATKVYGNPDLYYKIIDLNKDLFPTLVGTPGFIQVGWSLKY